MLLALVCCLGICRATSALETVVFERGGKTEQVEGQLLVHALDGGLLLLAPDGMMWMIQPGEIQSRTSDERPFVPLNQEEMAEKLLAEMPEGFRVYQTPHYTICYNTSLSYAQWCGGLYERLYRGFFNYWKTRGWNLKDPDFQLVALVFDSRESFNAYAEEELGDAADSVIGYYNMRSNRVNMYDLTGGDELKRIAPNISDMALINQILSRPGAERTVATIVHEATHQLSYNCGMQTRFADNPLWVSEGLAVFFESPDFKSARGWKTIGVVNRVHLDNFRRFALERPEDSLATLLRDDTRFRDPQRATDAYSEAWALNYYLLKRRSDDYVEYLQRLAEKKPLLQDGSEDRLALFEEVFGDPAALNAEFVRFILHLR
jgi:hypothetical protein